MTEIKMLEDVLKKHLKINAARINFLANFIIALLMVRTVNLTEIAVAFGGKGKKESHYKRLQRFFRFFPLDLDMIAKLIAALISQEGLWTLTMDRTNWKYGKLNINILTLGIAYKGIAFPIIWILLPKRGNSNTKERIQLIDRFIKIFGVKIIRCLTADREFIGEEWFSYLIDKCILFRIRIKENFLVANSRGILVPVKTLFRGLGVGETQVLEGRRSVLGQELFIIGHCLPDGEYLIIVTNDEPETALDEYSRRWEIETLFGCLKTRGFNFEATHITEPKRISKLMALLAIAFCWCHIVGEWLQTQKAIKIKKHGRKAISIFRYGLDELREIILDISRKMQAFKKMITLLANSLSSSFLCIETG
jgi:hypothetical protein